ncbi:MAG: hypothetical protein AAGJ79_00630 [Verrucomicrobiota bacterium]
MDISRALPVIAVGVMIFTSNCATKNYVAEPKLSVAGSKSAREAVDILFGQTPPPFTIQLCEADPSIRRCSPGKGGISAAGLGGIALPLVLDVTGIEVLEVQKDARGYSFTSRVDSKVNKIPPVCGKVKGRIIVSDSGTAVIKLSNFYCNWAVIGNVVTNLKLSLDSIDPKSRTFTGYYSLKFNGTGNAAGSGYYRAVVGR